MASDSKTLLEPFRNLTYLTSTQPDHWGEEDFKIEATITSRTSDAAGSIVLEGFCGHSMGSLDYFNPAKEFQLKLNLLKPVELITKTRPLGHNGKKERIQMSYRGTFLDGESVFMSTPLYSEKNYCWQGRNLYIFTLSKDPEKEGPYRLAENRSYTLS